MMHMATELAVLAPRAQVIGYTVAGKTGTAYKVEAMATTKINTLRPLPVSRQWASRALSWRVMVDDPTANGHYGGVVAAPIFSQIVSETYWPLSVAHRTRRIKPRSIKTAASRRPCNEIQTMNTRANQLSALQATVLTQVFSALGSYAQQKNTCPATVRKSSRVMPSLPTRLIRSHRTATNTTDAPYVDAAGANGAGAVLARSKPMPAAHDSGVPYRSFNFGGAHCPQLLWQPSDAMRMIAITGTNGPPARKWLRSRFWPNTICRAALWHVGVGFDAGKPASPRRLRLKLHHTSPTCAHKALKPWRWKCPHVLEQGRVNGVTCV